MTVLFKCEGDLSITLPFSRPGDVCPLGEKYGGAAQFYLNKNNDSAFGKLSFLTKGKGKVSMEVIIIFAEKNSTGYGYTHPIFLRRATVFVP